MKCPKDIIFWSCNFDRVDGQSAVSALVHKNFQDRIVLSLFYSVGLSGVPRWTFNCIALYFWVAFLKYQTALVYIVISRSPLGFLRDFPVLLLAFTGRRVVCHAHGSDIVTLCNNRFLGTLARFLFKKCIIIVPSMHLLGPLKEIGLSELVVIENPFLTGF